MTTPTAANSTLIDILDYRATYQGDRLAYEYLQNQDKLQLTYKELNQKAIAIATELQRQGLQNERILLIYPAGLEFVCAFLGCLYAGAVAVPVYPPRRNQKLSRLQTIVIDCTAKGVLTLSQLEGKIKVNLSNNIASLSYVLTDKINLKNSQPKIIKPTPEQLAFLQYTSGSTGNPKGVMITHLNIIHNSTMIKKCFEHTEESHFVSWLPSYHDMGLIAGILQPLYGGFPGTLISPTDFLRKPIIWLQAISECRATTSGAPNFAYEMCVEKIAPEAKKNLDLSSWNVAFNGAEPIRAETLDRFAEAFKECGFKKSAFYPCYGMAEATLMISGGFKKSLPVMTKNNNNKEIVGCGKITLVQEIVIINPKTRQLCQDREIGEIWVRNNNSIADGYWNNQKTTQETFKAKIVGDKNDYLRTGDLGFIEEGELFVTGRIKDVIIIRGQNYYPQDIEKTVERSHPALKANSGAAFSLEVEGKEQLVVVQEVERSYVRKLGIVGANFHSPVQELREEIEVAVKAAISQEFGLNIYDIKLIKTGSISKTSSGKIQRYLCKEKYLKEVRSQILIQKSPLLRRKTTEPSYESCSWGKPPRPHFRAAVTGVPRSEVNSKKVESIIQWLRDYAETNINSRIIDERRCIPPYIVLDFGNKGLLGMQVPKEYGGLGLNNYETMQIMEQLGAIDATLCLFVGLNNILGIRPILKYGSEELKKELLPILATGRELAAFALTERGAGSNPQAIVSKAITQSKNTWNIQGEKIWSGSAAWAGVTNIFVQHQDINGNYQGISAFVVRRGTPGLRQGKEALTMGMRGMIQNTVYFDDVTVTSGQLLGKPGKGMEVAQDAMMYGRLAIAFFSLGGMKRCAQLILRYTSRRQVSTGKLLDNPVILTRLGGLTAQITALECLVTQISKLLDRDVTIPVELYTACKTSAPEFYYQAADDLVQFLGGRGYIETNIAPQILRDARVLRIFEGPTETLNMFLGSRIINNDLDFVTFIQNTFDAADVYQQLMEAVEKIKTRFQHNPIFSKSIDNKRWIYILVGEITTYAILLAANKYSYQQNPSTEIKQAISWTELQLENQINNALTVTPNELVTETADKTSELIDSYVHSIGDIQQSLAGEDLEIDELLEIRGSRRVEGAEEQSFLKIEPRSLEKCNSHTNRSIQDWLSQWLSNKLQIPLDKIDRAKAFADYGIDSVMAVELAQDLEEWFPDNLEIEPTLAWNFPSIEALTGYLAEMQGRVGAVREPPLQKNGIRPDNNKQDIDTLSEDELAKSLLEEIALAKGRDN